jgi:tetratricopeptide (TPR) repeat protein
VVEPQAAYTWLDMLYDAPLTVAGLVLLFCAPVLLLLAIFFALRKRRRRKRAAESIPLPDESEPEVRALPMPADAQAEVWLREGVALAKQGKNKEALRTLRKVVRVTPDNPTAWLWLGLTAARSGDARSAERCFKRADRLGHPKAQQALEWLGAGGG